MDAPATVVPVACFALMSGGKNHAMMMMTMMMMSFEHMLYINIVYFTSVYNLTIVLLNRMVVAYDRRSNW